MHKQLYGLRAAKRPVELTLDSDLVAREKLDAEILQGCRVHDLYLAEYGSLGDAVRAGLLP